MPDVFHADLAGADLHDPRGKYPTALALADNQALAYEINNASTTLCFGIDTSNGSELVRSGINALTLNSDASIAANESCVLTMNGSSTITGVAAGILTIGTGGSWTAHTTIAGTAASTILHLGTSGITGTNSLAPRLTLNGTTNAGAANAGYLSVEYNSTQARGYFQLGTLFELKLANAANSFIIGGGTHGTYNTLASCVVIGDGANSGASSTSITGSTTVGAASAALFNSASAFGYQAAAAELRTTALGAVSNASGEDSVAVGYNAQTSSGGDFGVAVGGSSLVSAEAAMAFGFRAQNAILHSALFGGDDATGYIDRVCFGRGFASTTAPATVTLQVTDHNGGTTSGSGLTIRAGLGRSSGTSGDLIFQTGSGSGSPHTETTRLTLKGDTTGACIVAATSFLAFAERTAPSAIAGHALLYAKDLAGSTTMYTMNEAGVETAI